MKEIDFVERRNAAAAAKKARIEKMQRAPKADDPAVIARRAEKARVSSSKALQRGERDRLKREAEAQQKAEDEARALADALAAAAGLAESAERSIAEQAEQKAERDRRYAARKNRNR